MSKTNRDVPVKRLTRPTGVYQTRHPQDTLQSAHHRASVAPHHCRNCGAWGNFKENKHFCPR